MNSVEAHTVEIHTVEIHTVEIHTVEMHTVEIHTVEIHTVEMHTAGAPLRIVESGLPVIEGQTILEKRKYSREKLDNVRRMLMMEPRGHYNMYGVYLVDPDVPGADIGCIFIHNEGYSTMCGDAVISLGRYVVDHGIVKQPTSPETRVLMQCPCGPVEAFVEYKDGKTGNVRYNSVPAFLYKKDIHVDIPTFGDLKVDICYGGAFYAFIEDEQLGMDIKQTPINDMTEAAYMITEKLRKTIEISHPENPELSFLFGTIIVNGKNDDELSNVCVYADKHSDVDLGYIDVILSHDTLSNVPGIKKSFNP